MYLWYFPKKCRGMWMITPPPPMRVFMCEKNREGKSNLKMKGGGKEIKLMPEYTPLDRGTIK